MAELKFISSLHTATSRNYLGRMNDDKIKAMVVSRRYDKDYWDGERRYGYGGYNYIPGRWESVAKEFIKYYNLTNGSKILDVGCGKGFLLFEIKKLLPGCMIVGFDISEYAIKNAKEEIKEHVFVQQAQHKYNFKDQEFDLVISVTTLHNLILPDIKMALQEIERVGKQKFIVVESYRDEKELFDLQCWALTAKAFFMPTEWIWLFNEFNYTGDYEFIYFE